MRSLLGLSACAALVACVGTTAPTPTPAPSAGPEPEPPAGPTAEASDEPAAPVGEPILGEPEHLADALASLDGMWAYASEVWQIEAGEMLVYRPLDDDITTTRTLEMLAPCLVAVRESDDLVGIYGVHRRFQQQAGTYLEPVGLIGRGAAAHEVDKPPSYGELPPSPYTVCDVRKGFEPAVFAIDDKTCEGWLFDLDSERFVARGCVLGLPNEHHDRTASLVDERGDVIRQTQIPPKFWEGELIDRPPNAASACGGLPADKPGCSPAQAAVLHELYWSGEGASCSGASFRVEPEPLFDGESLAGLQDCPMQVREGEPIMRLEPGLVIQPESRRVRPGAKLQLEFVIENTDADPRFARLPSSTLDFRVRKDGQDYRMGECSALGLIGTGPRSNAIEYRLDPGGTLTLAADWWARSPVDRGEDCEVRPLKPGTYTVEIVDEHEGQVTVLFSAEVRVAGKKTCDPCPPAGS